MKVLTYIPHYGWLFGLASSMPNDSFYVVNKVEPDEQRGGDLSVVSGYWTWLRSIKPKPSNIKILGLSWSEIDQDDYDVAMLIPDANQMRLAKHLSKMPLVFKFHLANIGTKMVFDEIKQKTGKLPTGEYPLIFSAHSQKAFYGYEGKVAWSQSPEYYKDWNGELERALWVCERIGAPGEIRWVLRGGRIWSQIADKVPSIRIGLDFRLGTPITTFEETLFNYRYNRVFVECAEDTPLTDALVEAMMTGMPPVVFAANDMDLIIEHGVNGFKSKDPNEMIKYIQILLKDLDLAKEISIKARKTALEHWGPKVSEEAYHQAFEKAFQVYNAYHDLPKLPIKDFKFESSTGDQYLLETSIRKTKELTDAYETPLTASLECPYCYTRYKLIHHKGKHKLDKATPPIKGEKRIPVYGYPPEFFQPAKIRKEEIKIPEILGDIYKTSIPCSHCRGDLVIRNKDIAICVGCKRMLGKWDEWVTTENRY